jgi:hypothetical protein
MKVDELQALGGCYTAEYVNKLAPSKLKKLLKEHPELKYLVKSKSK